MAPGRGRALARADRHSDGQALGRENVALLAVEVVQQGDVGGAVGVVLDRRHLRRDAVLAPLEVDAAVGALGAAAAVARGLAPVGVSPAALREPFGEALLGARARQLGEVRVGDEAPAGASGLWLADRHLA